MHTISSRKVLKCQICSSSYRRFAYRTIIFHRDSYPISIAFWNSTDAPFICHTVFIFLGTLLSFSRRFDSLNPRIFIGIFSFYSLLVSKIIRRRENLLNNGLARDLRGAHFFFIASPTTACLLSGSPKVRPFRHQLSDIKSTKRYGPSRWAFRQRCLENQSNLMSV